MRSASTSPSAVFTTVPSGTRTTRSAPSAPLRLEPEPGLPLPARRTGRRWKSSSVDVPGSTSRITSPPRPPLPPSGPPSGLNFSRRIEAQPCPPSPACTRNSAWSANSATCAPGPEALPPCLAGLGGRVRARFRRDHAHRAAPAPGAELYPPADQREQRVIAAAAHPGPGVEVGSALPHDDLARADELAAEALDPESLGVGVPAVPAG